MDKLMDGRIDNSRLASQINMTDYIDPYVSHIDE